MPEVNKTILLFEQENLMVTQYQTVFRCDQKRDALYGRNGKICLCGHDLISSSNKNIGMAVAETIDLRGGNAFLVLLQAFLAGQVKGTASDVILNGRKFSYSVKSKNTTNLNLMLMAPPFPQLFLTPAEARNATMCIVHLLKFLAGQ